MQEVDVPLDAPLRFNINLVEDGSVITEDGEYIGSWELDENGFAYFTPDGSSEVMLIDPFVGLLCKQNLKIGTMKMERILKVFDNYVKSSRLRSPELYFASDYFNKFYVQ